MNVPGYFLDTNILVTAFLIDKSDSGRLLELGRKGKARLLTSDYVLRELRYVLARKLRVPASAVESFILDEIAPNMLILRKPSHPEVRRFRLRLRDRSDTPILVPCVKHGLTLVTLDSRFARSARGRIGVASPSDAVKSILRSTS